MKNIFASIDIGSDSIKLVVCEFYNNKIHLLSASSVKSKGIKKGVIIDADKAATSIRNSLIEVESTLGIKIKNIISSVPTYFADFIFIKGEIRIVNENNVVTSKDIVEVLQLAMDSKLSNDKEMVTIIPVDFKLDDTEEIQNPLGHVGKVLSARAIMITTPRKNIYSVAATLSAAGLELDDIMINSIGDIHSLKSREAENLVGAIVNIGAETTNVSLYNKGIVVKNSVLGIGVKEIDLDIANQYNVEIDDAKRIKEKFALAHTKYSNVSDYYEIKNISNDDIKINQFEVSEIAMKRMEGIVNLAIKEINILSTKEPDFIIFTGGGSNIAHFSYLLSERIGKKAKIGTVNVVGARKNIYSAAIGNIIYFINKMKLKGKTYSMLSNKEMDDLSSVRKNTANISSDSMLGKLVGYFFGE